MAGLYDGIDPQTALLLGLGSGLLGTVGQGRRASFGEALANGMQAGTAGYRQAVGDRQRAEQMRAEQQMREQQMRMQMEEATRAQGRYGMEQKQFDMKMSAATQAQADAKRLRDLLAQNTINVGPTLEGPPESRLDRQGYANALETIDPDAGAEYRQKITPKPLAPIKAGRDDRVLDPVTYRVLVDAMPKEQTPTDAKKKFDELVPVYGETIARAIAYNLLKVVPDGNGGTAIVYEPDALGNITGAQPGQAQQGSPSAPRVGMTPGMAPPAGSASPAAPRGAFDAPPPLPGQIGGNPGNKNAQARIAAEESLRKEFTSLAPVKSYSQAFPAYKNILDASKRDNTQADINIVYGLAKLYDPDSVVREGEYATIANSQAIPEKIKGFANYLMGGGRLTAETRKQLIAEATSRHNILRQGYEQSSKQYRDLASKSGLSQDSVITAFGERARVATKDQIDSTLRNNPGMTRSQAWKILEDNNFEIQDPMYRPQSTGQQRPGPSMRGPGLGG